MEFVTRTFRVVHAYLFIYLVGMIASIGLGAMGYTTAAPRVAWFAFIVCAVLSYSFGARMVLGAGAYKGLRGFIQFIGGPDSTTAPRLLSTVWYWQAFVAMWASVPLAALAIVKPWEQGRTFELVAATFMVLHVVATQRGGEKIWRKVYAGLAVAYVAGILFSVVMPSEFHLLTAKLGYHEALTQVDADALNTQAADDKAYLASLQVQGNKYKAEYRKHVRDANGRNNQYDRDWTADNASDWAAVTEQIEEMLRPQEEAVSLDWISRARGLDPYLILILTGGLLLTAIAVSEVASKSSTSKPSTAAAITATTTKETAK